jgi:6-phosphogluconolactonase (cycloisomerase 2 family)
MRIPPELRAVDKDERDVHLSSQGLVEVRFYQDADPISFKGEARIEVPMGSESGLLGGERINLYHYDEERGRFKQEGQAVVSDDQKWVATVDKFSWWTAAGVIEDPGCVSAELRTPSDDSAAGVVVTATGRDQLWSSSALSDADGQVCIQAPQGSQLSLAAFWMEGDADGAWSQSAAVPEAGAMCGGDACANLGAQRLGGIEGDAGVAPQDDAGTSSSELFYVVNATPNGSSGFVTTLRMAADGTLTEQGARTTGVGRPLSMAKSPDARFLYLPSVSNDHISTLAIDPDTGALSMVGQPAVTEQSPQQIMVHPSGAFLYAANFSGRSVSIFSNPADDGQLVAQGSVPSGGYASQMAGDPEFRFLFVSNRDSSSLSSFEVDPSSGQLTPVQASIPTGTGRPNHLVTTHDGRFLFVQLLSDQTIAAFEVSASGMLTPIEPPTAVASVSNLRMHPTLDVMYVTSGGSEPAVSTFSVAADGSLGALGSPLAAGSGAGRIIIEPAARFAFVLNTLSNDISTYTIEASGELSAGPLFDGAALSNPTDGTFVSLAR